MCFHDNFKLEYLETKCWKTSYPKIYMVLYALPAKRGFNKEEEEALFFHFRA